MIGQTASESIVDIGGRQGEEDPFSSTLFGRGNRRPGASSSHD
jgi:hypothetical protein